MFGTTLTAARARYRDVDVTAQVEAATPHQLIAILYDELQKTLDVMAASLAANGERGALLKRRARAASILLGLESSLDHSQGGALSASLAAIYREARRLIAQAISTSDPAPVLEARQMIAEIATAWRQIA